MRNFGNRDEGLDSDSGSGIGFLHGMLCFP
jgi:hypothetical protein